MADQHTRRAVFRAEGSVAIGHGHVRRCLSLARSLATRGWECSFYSPSTAPDVREIVGPSFPVDETPPPITDAVIADHYDVTVDDEADLREFGGLLLAIDDRPTRSHDCDMLLDASPGRAADAYAGLVPDNCTMLVGPSYALLGPAFARERTESLARRRQSPAIERVLISLGAADRNGMTRRLLEVLPHLFPDITFDVAVPSSFSHLAHLEDLTRNATNAALHVYGDMAKLMGAADVAIGAGGTTSLERCCMGLPSIVVITADNQEGVARGLGEAKAASIVGKIDDEVETRVAQELGRLAEEPSRLAAMSAAAARLCDGRGSDRVAEILRLATLRAGSS